MKGSPTPQSPPVKPGRFVGVYAHRHKWAIQYIDPGGQHRTRGRRDLTTREQFEAWGLEVKARLDAGLFGDSRDAPPPIPTKLCAGCLAHKPLTDFSPSKSTRDRLVSKCKPCRCREQAAYTHKVTPAEQAAMLEGQGGGCGVCGTQAPGGNGSFHIDHDHQTGKVRGLLCFACNVGIGKLGDTAASVYRAVDYLLRAA